MLLYRKKISSGPVVVTCPIGSGNKQWYAVTVVRVAEMVVLVQVVKRVMKED